jgi:hypothetical protein
MSNRRHQLFGILLSRPNKPHRGPFDAQWNPIGMEEIMPKFFSDLVDDKTIFNKKGVTLPNAKEAAERRLREDYFGGLRSALRVERAIRSPTRS